MQTKKINLTSTDLTDTDLIYLKELKQINNKNYTKMVEIKFFNKW